MSQDALITPADPLSLPALVDHAEQVQGGTPVEAVFEQFRHHPFEFMAVTEGGHFLGLVSRGHLGLLLGTRYGFTLHSRRPVRDHLLPEPLVVAPERPLLDVLESALSRTGEAFYHDLALVTAAGAFLGIIPVPALVRAQSQLMLQKIRQVRELEQSAALNEKRAMLETLVGGIAHELNNKLAPAQGYAELLGLRLARAGGFQELQGFARMIEASVQESSKIIQQLKNLCQPSLECAATDPRTLIEEAMVLMRFRLRAAEARITLDLPAPCPPIWVDPGQLKQVLINLILNALDAMEHAAEKTLQIRARVDAQAVTIEIQDTGEGIPPDRLNRIFDPFYTTKAMDKGTGLGLSVCLGIVKQHHGSILAESTPGQGTTFRVTLPRAQEPATELQPAPVVLRQPDPAPCGRLEVMVVDDEEHITALVQDTLWNQLGWKVTRVHGGHEALRVLEGRQIDLMITDLRMPGLDGFGVLDWVREQRPGLYLRTMVITGDAGGARQTGELQGLNLPVLRKPFSPMELARTCESLWAGGRLGH